MRASKMIQRTHFQSQNDLGAHSKGAPNMDRLHLHFFTHILQLLGRNSNKCCFLATCVAFCEKSQLGCSKFVLNFLRTKNLVWFWSYDYLKFLKFSNLKNGKKCLSRLAGKGLRLNFTVPVLQLVKFSRKSGFFAIKWRIIQIGSHKSLWGCQIGSSKRSGL